MKLNIAFSALLLALHSGPFKVQAGFPDEEMSRELKNDKDKLKENHTENNMDDEEVEIMVQYYNENGKEKVKHHAATGKFEKDISKFKVASIKASRKEIEKMKMDPDIKYVEVSETLYALPHVRVRDASIADERRLAETTPYGITMVQADQVTQGNTNIKVCVADTGYGIGHEDLPDNEDGMAEPIDGFSPYGSGELWNVDGHGHGSHCAGTIGAIGNNNIGVTSVNPDPTKFSFYIGKALRDSGSGSSAGVLEAVAKCADMGANIISMSLGGGGYSQIAADTYEEIYNSGVLIVAAAGNAGNSGNHYPASYPALMSVAAVDSSETKASFSVFNSQTEIAAPGVGVKSTLPVTTASSGYGSWSGTSMACPHVAGVAALVWSNFPDCSNSQIRNVLIKTAKDKGAAGCDTSYGHGIVQARAAYDLLSLEGCEAGGIDSVMVGGCDQDPNYTPPPTSAPTPLPTCPNNVETFAMELITDNYGDETSWSLVDDCSEGAEVVASGSDYSSGTTYNIVHCLEDGKYTLTINDTYGDGICCSYGQGSYEAHFKGNVVVSGGEFTSSESTSFGECSSSPSEWVEVSNANFENGWNGWQDGGGDVRKNANDAPYCRGATGFCIRLRDNSGEASSMTLAIDALQYTQLEVKFYYYAVSMDNQEDFWLQASNDGGNSWDTIKVWRRNASDPAEGNIVNGQMSLEQVVPIDGTTYGVNTQLRFRCDASGNNDRIYIDDVVVMGLTSSSSSR